MRKTFFNFLWNFGYPFPIFCESTPLSKTLKKRKHIQKDWRKWSREERISDAARRSSKSDCRVFSTRCWVRCMVGSQRNDNSKDRYIISCKDRLISKHCRIFSCKDHRISCKDRHITQFQGSSENRCKDCSWLDRRINFTDRHNFKDRRLIICKERYMIQLQQGASA